MSDSAIYLVWSHEHGAWWRLGAAGYTQQLYNAGRFTREEALRICTMALPGAEHALNELPVRLDDIEAMAARYQQVYGDRKERWM